MCPEIKEKIKVNPVDLLETVLDDDTSRKLQPLLEHYRTICNSEVELELVLDTDHFFMRTENGNNGRSTEVESRETTEDS